MTKQDSKLFKDELDHQAVISLAHALHSAHSDLPTEEFIAACLDGLQDMELKARVRHISAVIQRLIPASYPDALTIVTNAAKNELPGFVAWPLLDWVETHGLDHPEISLAALRRMTSTFSAEFAIRPYLLQHTELCLQTLAAWTEDPDQHTRRLVSEGTRPRLPWGQRLPMFMADPAPVIALLERLKDDPEEYVRRSVANNLNDIAKDHPDLVATMGARWIESAPTERQRLVKHGLRTLIKQGHTGALEALGYTTRPRVEVAFRLDAADLHFGDDLLLHAEVLSRSRKTQKLVVDFAVHYRKANGSLAPKIFKWKVVDLPPGGKWC